MKLRIFPLILVLLSTLVGCQDGAPTNPSPEGPGPSPELELSQVDDSDDGYRGLTALMTGTASLKGAVVNEPGYTDSPTSITQAATIGELVLLRLSAVMSDGSTPKVYTDVRGPGGAYSSMSFNANGTNNYKALYVLRNEDLSLRLHNRTSYSGALHNPAAIFTYSYETRSIQDSAEPNDDGNPVTITDRTMGANVNVGSTANRSFYYYTSTKKDIEDWYKTDLTAGRTYRFRVSSFSPRYGTWSYTIKLFNSAGTQLGATVTVPQTATIGDIITSPVASTGTYYLQIKGTPGKVAFSSNVFYSAYSVTPCEVPVVNTTTGLTFTPAPGVTTTCPGISGQWGYSTPAPVASWTWNFGGGCIPNTSTELNPDVTYTTIPGTYNCTLTLTAPCGATYTAVKSYRVDCSWSQSYGRASTGGIDNEVTALDSAVDSAGNAWITGKFTGLDVRFPREEGYGDVITLNSGGSGTLPRGFLMKIAPNGTVLWSGPLASESATGESTGEAIVIDASDNPWVTGNFTDSLDFDPGSGVSMLTSAGDYDAFLVQYGSDGAPGRPAVRWGGPGLDQSRQLIADSSWQLLLCGRFADTVDFDPGAGVVNRTALTGNNLYLLRLTTSGNLDALSTWGGENSTSLFRIGVSSTKLYAAGFFTGTTDFDPGAGVTEYTSLGTSDIYLTALNRSSLAYEWTATLGATTGGASQNLRGLAVNGLGAPRLVADIVGPVRLTYPGDDPITFGDGSVDILVVALASDGLYEWYGLADNLQNRTTATVEYSSYLDSLLIAGTYTSGSFGVPGNGSTSLTALDTRDAFLWRIGATTPNHYWARSMGSASTTRDQIRSIGIQPSGNKNIFISGTYRTSSSGLGGITLSGGNDGWTGFTSRLDRNAAWMP